MIVKGIIKETYSCSVKKHYLAFYFNHKPHDDDGRFLRLHTPVCWTYGSGEPHKITTPKPL